MSEDQVAFQRDRAKAWPSGLFITSLDIKQYIDEFETEADLAIEKTKYKVGLGFEQADDWRQGTIWERNHLDEEDDS